MRTSREEQHRMVADWQASGLSIAAYARAAGIVYHRLVYWVRKRDQMFDDGADPLFEEHRLSQRPTTSADAVVLQFTGGPGGCYSAEVRLRGTPSASFVAQVLREVLR